MQQPERSHSSYDLSIFADYCHFFLQDENAEGDISESWNAQAITTMFVVDFGIIGIGTARNTRVPVHISLLTNPSHEDLTQWDHVTEASIDLSSGKLVVAGPSDYFPDTIRIVVKAGIYRARIFYRELNSIHNNGLDGDDGYRVVLWADSFKPPIILKQRQLS